MTRFRVTEFHLLVVSDLKRFVVLGQPLIEPGRDLRFSEICPDYKVNIFVKNNPEYIIILTLG